MTTFRWMAAALALQLVAMSPTSQAQPIIDGTADGSYGAALSTQNTRTHFGDATGGDRVQTRSNTSGGGGSEIDQVFGTIANDRLYVTIAGNLENNFNKLNIYIDSIAGGVNEINGDIFTPEDNNVPPGVDPFCCGGFAPPNGSNQDGEGAFSRGDGLTLDTGFEADYFLSFTHGQENVDGTNFWAMSAHYADMTQGVDGDVVAAGMVLAPQGMPNVLRAQGDGLGDTPASIRNADDGTQAGNVDTTSIGPALPGLSQGQVIDRNYAISTDGGCNADDSGAGCVAPELEFALNVDPNDAGNTKSHRNFNNTIGLEMAIDNSNTAGVLGSGDAPWGVVGGEDDPENVITGIEFSIPLSAIGNPTDDIRLTAFVNGSNQDFVSNQFAGDGSLEGFEGGDGNGGGTGDLAGVDLSQIAGDQFVTISASAPSADLDGDGDVDGADFLLAQREPNPAAAIALWASQYPSPLAAASTVPEPSAALLMMLGALGILARRQG